MRMRVTGVNGNEILLISTSITTIQILKNINIIISIGTVKKIL